MNTAVNHCRGNNTQQINQRFQEWVNPEGEKVPLEPSVPAACGTKESRRGWNHPHLAAMMMPIVYEVNKE